MKLTKSIAAIATAAGLVCASAFAFDYQANNIWSFTASATSTNAVSLVNAGYKSFELGAMTSPSNAVVNVSYVTKAGLEFPVGTYSNGTFATKMAFVPPARKGESYKFTTTSTTWVPILVLYGVMQ